MPLIPPTAIISKTRLYRSFNKRANQYNEQIRTKNLDKESELSTGDFFDGGQNNYFWLKETDEAGFIANDIIEILEIFIKELYGFKFAKVKCEWSIIQQIPLKPFYY
jgi:hypothetical protein